MYLCARSARQTQRPKKKRKRDDDLNEFLPDRHPEESEQYGSLEFNELLDEQVCHAPGSRLEQPTTRTVWSTPLPCCLWRLLKLSI